MKRQATRSASSKTTTISRPGASQASKWYLRERPGESLRRPGVLAESKDTGASIARANGVSLGDLMKVNPSVNWSKLSVGDKIKLPKK